MEGIFRLIAIIIVFALAMIIILFVCWVMDNFFTLSGHHTIVDWSSLSGILSSISIGFWIMLIIVGAMITFIVFSLAEE